MNTNNPRCVVCHGPLQMQDATCHELYAVWYRAGHKWVVLHCTHCNYHNFSGWLED